MSLAGKVFKNNVTGSTIKVIDSFENIAILENKQKIDVKTLMDSNQYTEQIDPSSFFNNQGAYNILAEKIKTIPSHLIQDEEGTLPVVTPTSGVDGFNPATNESAIIMGNEDDEKAELARKYGVSMGDNSLQKQNEAFAKLLGEDGENELPQVPVQTFNENVQRVEVRRDEISRPLTTEPVVEKRVEDPIITMFKRTKRNVEFKINVEVSDKIPRLDFIEMMEDSYEISMIDFLADEFTNKILQDPSVIRDSIKDKIKQLVYGGEIKTPVNPQITDAVTQLKEDVSFNKKTGEVKTEKHESLPIEKEPVLTKDLPKKTTTRKPRVKKETEQK